MITPEILSERLSKEAKKRGISITNLCKSCELNKNFLYSMRAGSYPKLDNLIKIALALDISVDDLLT